MYLLIEFIGVLADSTIRKIEPRPDKLCLSASQSDILFNRLEESGATGLHELIVKVCNLIIVLMVTVVALLTIVFMLSLFWVQFKGNIVNPFFCIL